MCQIPALTDRLSRIIKSLSPDLETEKSLFDFRQIQRVFLPIALIARGNYAASECRRPAKPVNSTPAYVVTYQARCNTISCEILQVLVPRHGFYGRLTYAPPPIAARSSYLFTSMNYETMLLGFRLHAFPFFGR